MSSNAAKGQRYKAKSKSWLEANGYTVAHLERMQIIPRPGRPIFVKRDQLGADLLAVREDEGLFVQVKFFGASDRRHALTMRDAEREFRKYPCPPGCKQVILVWRKNVRLPELTYLKPLTNGLDSSMGGSTVDANDNDTETARVLSDVAGETHRDCSQGRAQRAPQGGGASMDQRRSARRRPARRVRHTGAETPEGS